MTGVPASGMEAAQARIAEIQAQLRQLASAGTPPGGVVGNAGAAGGFQDLVARAAAAPAASAAPATAPTGAAAPPRAAAVRTATAASSTPPTEGPAGAWARRLPEAGRPWAAAIQETAERHGLDPALLASLVWTESGFRPDAVSHAGARGLTQLMPATAAGMGVDPDDPAQNLEGGARFLRAMMDRFGTVELGLAAYNAGPGRVAQAGGIPRIPETQAYVPAVLGHYAHLQGAH